MGAALGTLSVLDATTVPLMLKGLGEPAVKSLLESIHPDFEAVMV
jgi:hypothetical protein